MTRTAVAMPASTTELPSELPLELPSELPSELLSEWTQNENRFIAKQKDEIQKFAEIVAHRPIKTTHVNAQKILVYEIIAQILEAKAKGESPMFWASMNTGALAGTLRYTFIRYGQYGQYPTIMDMTSGLINALPHSNVVSIQRRQKDSFYNSTVPGDTFGIILLPPLLLWQEVLENSAWKMVDFLEYGLPPVLWPLKNVRERAGIKGPLFVNCWSGILVMLSNLLDASSREKLLRNLASTLYCQVEDEGVLPSTMDCDQLYDEYLDIFIEGVGISRPEKMNPHFASERLGLISFHGDEEPDLGIVKLHSCPHVGILLPESMCSDRCGNNCVFHIFQVPTAKTVEESVPRITTYRWGQKNELFWPIQLPNLELTELFT